MSTMMLRRGMVSEDGPGWAVTDHEDKPLPGRWDTEEEARENGYLGIYLLSGVNVAKVDKVCQECGTHNGEQHGWGCDLVLHGDVELVNGQPPLVTDYDCMEV